MTREQKRERRAAILAYLIANPSERRVDTADKFGVSRDLVRKIAESNGVWHQPKPPKVYSCPDCGAQTSGP